MIKLIADQLLLICFFMSNLDRVGIIILDEFQKEGEQ